MTFLQVYGATVCAVMTMFVVSFAVQIVLAIFGAARKARIGK